MSLGKEALPRGIPRKRDRHLQKYHKPPHVLSVKFTPDVVPPHQFSELVHRPVYPVHQETHGKIRHTPTKRHKGQITQEFAKYSLEGISESDGAEG